MMPEDSEVRRLIATAKERVQSRLRKDHFNPQLNPSLAKRIEKIGIGSGVRQFGYSEYASMATEFQQKLRSVGDTASLGLLDLIRAQDYQDGHHVEANDKKAYDLYKKASDVGLIEAKYNLAIIISRGRGCPPDPVTAFSILDEIVGNNCTLTSKDEFVQDILLKMSKSIPPFAMYAIGLRYSNGVGVPRDVFRGFEWFLKSADAGHPPGHDAVGLAYWHAEGVMQDIARAQRHLETAVRLGDINALINLAKLHLSGSISGLPDVEKAKELLSAAKKAGHLAAEEILAHLPPVPTSKFPTAGMDLEALEVLKQRNIKSQSQPKPMNLAWRTTTLEASLAEDNSAYAALLRQALSHWKDCINIYREFEHLTEVPENTIESMATAYYKATEIAEYACTVPENFFQSILRFVEAIYAKKPDNSEIAYASVRVATFSPDLTLPAKVATRPSLYELYG
jgi:TPR repeat protein